MSHITAKAYKESSMDPELGPDLSNTGFQDTRDATIRKLRSQVRQLQNKLENVSVIKNNQLSNLKARLSESEYQLGKAKLRIQDYESALRSIDGLVQRVNRELGS